MGDIKAKYWTTNGKDIWGVKERRVFEFKNLETGKAVTCDCVIDVMDHGFLPVIMPKDKKVKVKKVKVKKAKDKNAKAEKVKAEKVKAENAKAKKAKVKKRSIEKAEKISRRPRTRSKYKGVSPSKTPGKFRVQFWDGKKNIYLGSFDSELLAAAKYQDHIGNHKEAKRLRNEYEEGDRRPEAPETEVIHKKMFPEDRPLTSQDSPVLGT